MLSRKSAQRRPRVLVMDGDPANRHALLDHLCHAGFEVAEAGDRTEFCLKLLTWRPDVVLAAAAARYRDNRSLVRLVRDSARRPVPAVLLADHAPSAEVGARIVLEPFAFAEVVRELNAALLGRDALPAAGHLSEAAREA